MPLLGFIEKQNARRTLILTLGLVLITGVFDQVTGYELSFSFFYLAPVAIAAWFLSSRFGLLIACLSAATWALADRTSGHLYTSELIFYWNGLIRLGIFVTVAITLARLRQALDTEKRLARTDYLTQACNSRFFHERLHGEITRARRYGHSLALAYIDLDNFKQVNDHQGHAAGDRLLQRATQSMLRSVRATDVVARIGGDEFAVLLPETGPSAARHAVDRLFAQLHGELVKAGVPVTCSIGVVGCSGVFPDATELLKLADSAMYQAKALGKNQIHFAVFPAADNEQMAGRAQTDPSAHKAL